MTANASRCPGICTLVNTAVAFPYGTWEDDEKDLHEPAIPSVAAQVVRGDSSADQLRLAQAAAAVRPAAPPAVGGPPGAYGACGGQFGRDVRAWDHRGHGRFATGQTVQLTVNFDRPIQIDTTNGFPTLPLNVHGIGAYSGTSGTTALTFLYTVAAGQNTSDLTVTALLLNGSAITLPGSPTNADLSGAATNPAGILQIDTQAPTVTSFTLLGSANQNAGSVVQYAITFSEPVTGVDTSQFSVTSSGVAGASVTSVTPGVDAAHYTVNVASGNVDSGTGVGTVTLNLTGANIKDLAGNGPGGGLFSAAPGSPFAVATPPFSENPVAVVIADINNDGIPDLVTADGQATSVCCWEAAAAVSAPLPAPPTLVSVSALHGDCGHQRRWHPRYRHRQRSRRHHHPAQCAVGQRQRLVHRRHRLTVLPWRKSARRGDCGRQRRRQARRCHRQRRISVSTAKTSVCCWGMATARSACLRLSLPRRRESEFGGGRGRRRRFPRPRHRQR